MIIIILCILSYQLDPQLRKCWSWISSKSPFNRRIKYMTTLRFSQTCMKIYRLWKSTWINSSGFRMSLNCLFSFVAVTCCNIMMYILAGSSIHMFHMNIMWEEGHTIFTQFLRLAGLKYHNKFNALKMEITSCEFGIYYLQEKLT